MSTPAPRPRLPLIYPVRNSGFLFGKPVYENLEPWTFEVAVTPEDVRTFTVPKGYLFDGASIPRFLRNSITGYEPFGVHIGAALEHDFLCDVGKKTAQFVGWMTDRRIPIPQAVPSAAAHEHFYRRLKQDGLRGSQAWTMGNAVKLFGPRWKV